MSNVAFLAVRGGSKSIPLKNIKLFMGKPLVYWAAKAANDAQCIDRVVIATDSDIIQSCVSRFQMNKVEIYMRSSENARDESSTESVMLEYISNSHTSDDDKMFLIQATSPLLKSKDIENIFSEMIKKNGDSALSCVRCKRFFWTESGSPINYDYQKRPRRQDFSGIMMENGAVYVNSVKNIKADRNRLSGKVVIYEMSKHTAIELDEPEDWVMLEQLKENIYEF